MSRFTQYPHRSLRRFAVVVAMVAFALFASAANATTLPVGPGGGVCTYSTIQAAINAATSGDSITIADAGTNYSEKLTVSNKSLSFSSCSCNHQVCLYDNTHNLLTNVTISGAGGANAPVLKIVTTNANNPVTVNLDRVTIQDGHSGSTDGGGISFSGVGALNLTRTNVTGNTANYGAGINFKANGGAATLTINHDTFITYNVAATSGGGIRVEGAGATLTANAANTWIAYNQALGGLGGGLEIINAAIANVGSAGYLFGGVIYENSASKGGGIALSDGLLNLYTTDPLRPVAIDNNTAYANGGGIYIDPATDHDVSLCAENYRITNNIAQQGSALYALAPSKNISLDHVNFDSCDQLASLGSVPCAAGQQCSVIQGNIAENAAVAPPSATDGAAIDIEGTAFFNADRLNLRDNTGGYAVKLNAGSGFLRAEFDNCLIADNSASHELISSTNGDVALAISNCTLAHNGIGGSRVITAENILSLNYNIIEQGGALPALAFSGNAADLDNQFNIAGNTSGMASTPYNIQTSPTFIDAAHGDYRLFYGYRGGALVRSAGLDYAPPFTGDPVDDHDLRNAPRDQTVANPLFGHRDLGAYEMQGVGDRIFISTYGDDILLVQ